MNLLNSAACQLLSRVTKGLNVNHTMVFRQRGAKELKVTNIGDGQYTLAHYVHTGCGQAWCDPKMTFWFDGNTWTPLDYVNDCEEKPYRAAAVVHNGAEVQVIDADWHRELVVFFNDVWAEDINFNFFSEDDD